MKKLALVLGLLVVLGELGSTSAAAGRSLETDTTDYGYYASWTNTCQYAGHVRVVKSFGFKSNMDCSS